jgi:hypothetical protein
LITVGQCGINFQHRTHEVLLPKNIDMVMLAHYHVNYYRQAEMKFRSLLESKDVKNPEVA